MFWKPEAMVAFSLGCGSVAPATTSAVPPAFSIFSLAEAENASALTVNFLVSSPSPRIFTACELRGTRPAPCSAARSTVPPAKRSSSRADVDREDLLAEGVLEALLREAALHRHLTALEAEARAVVAGAGLLALDALARLLAGARARTAADALAVAGRALRALQRVQRGSHCRSLSSSREW